MIPRGVEIFVGLEPIDLRWSFDRLAGIVADRMGREVRSSALFVFFGKRRESIKILFFDGSGLCLFYKRLDKRTFKLPGPSGASSAPNVIEIDERTLDDLLDGIDLGKPAKRRQKKPKTTLH
jgi:transposase